MDDLLNEFLSETSRELAAIDAALADIGGGTIEAATLAALCDVLHTVKGTSGFLGLVRLEALAVTAEPVFTKMRDDTNAAPADAAALGRAVTVQMQSVLAEVQAQQVEPEGDDADLMDWLRLAADGRSRPITDAVEAEAEAHTALDAVPSPPDRTETDPGMPPAPLRAGIPVAPRRMESLTELVGELVLTRNALNHLIEARDEDEELIVPIRRLDQITTRLGTEVMDSRIQPDGSEWPELARPFDVFPSVIVMCGAVTLAVPHADILRLAAPYTDDPRDVAIAEDGTKATVDGETYPFVRLADVLSPGERGGAGRRREVVGVVQAAARTFALGFERVLRTEEIVARSVPPVLRDIGLYAGCAVLGDGSVALILDIDGVDTATGASPVSEFA